MFYRVHSQGLFGLSSYPVEVEVDISQGLPSFEVVGLPDSAVRESKDRTRAAITNSGLIFPLGKIIVNLAPADVKKQGSFYDLPILLGILSASGQLHAPLEDAAFLGELSLSGQLRRCNGVLPMVLAAREQGLARIFIPADCAAEASVVDGIAIYPVPDLPALLAHLNGEAPLRPATAADFPTDEPAELLDFADVRGQQSAKRALEVAAAGGHNILLIGPPGAGKSMLAKRLPSILPEMTFTESLETTKIHSVYGALESGRTLIATRPFRAPHHTISPAGLAGGGSIPRPGEISLAHNGVLFLDELPEFSRTAMEVLRQPIEDGRVTISRTAGTLTYPCSVMLVAAMNPCPCGYYGHPTKPCTCAPGAAARYLSRVSGPLLDRLDLHIEVSPVEYSHLASESPEERSADIRARVNTARRMQQARYAGAGVSCNAKLPPALVREHCRPDPEAARLLASAFDNMGLSARAYDRILKVSRTIADLAGSDTIRRAHIAEAVQYRSLDRKYWVR